MARGFERPDWWYEPDCEDKYECPDCEKREFEIEEATKNLAKLLRQMYNPGGFVPEEFENSLENLCDALNMNIPLKPLNIVAKKNEVE